jgi:osmotically-inducible protein OsmY
MVVATADKSTQNSKTECFQMVSRTNPAERDREIEHQVRTALASRHIPSLRRLTVSSVEGDVKVLGNVRSFYEKQLVNQCCQGVAGVGCIDNAVAVDDLARRNPVIA